jgi:hypothetical protein
MNEIYSLQDSLFIDGYLVFQISTSIDEKLNEGNSSYVCNIFWLSNLNQIEDKRYWIYCLPGDLGISEFVFQINSTNDTSLNSKVFNEFYQRYQHFYNLNSTNFPFLLKFLTTEIFQKSITFCNFKNSDTIGYYIFDNSFIGFLIDENVLMNQYKVTKSTKEDIKVMIPISKSCKFEPTKIDELISVGFQKSNWVPKNLLNEKSVEVIDK